MCSREYYLGLIILHTIFVPLKIVRARVIPIQPPHHSTTAHLIPPSVVYFFFAPLLSSFFSYLKPLQYIYIYIHTFYPPYHFLLQSITPAYLVTTQPKLYTHLSNYPLIHHPSHSMFLFHLDLHHLASSPFYSRMYRIEILHDFGGNE